MQLQSDGIFYYFQSKSLNPDQYVYYINLDSFSLQNWIEEKKNKKQENVHTSE